MNILILTASELHQTALTVARLEATERHWSRLAAILGRVEDETLSPGLGYANPMAYATLVLGLSVDEYMVLRGLWRMVKTSPRVAFETWAAVPKSHALQIKRAVSLGGDAGEWIEKAKGMTADELRRAIDEQVGKEPWVTFKCAIPASLAELLEEALILALPEATGEFSPAHEMVTARIVRAKCMEVLTRRAINSGPGPGPDLSARALVSIVYGWLQDVTADPRFDRDPGVLIPRLAQELRLALTGPAPVYRDATLAEVAVKIVRECLGGTDA